MSPAGTFLADALLAGAIIAIPTAAVAWLGGRVAAGPATRHLLWSAALTSFIAPFFGLSLLWAAGHVAPIGLGTAVQLSRVSKPAPTLHSAPPPGPEVPLGLATAAPARKHPFVIHARPAPDVWHPAPAAVSPLLQAPQVRAPAVANRPTDSPARPHPLTSLRRALLAQGPLPLLLWAAGAVPMLGAIFIASIRTRRLVRRATPATAETLRVVNDAAIAMRLPRRPSVLFTTRRVSPMLVCAARPALILPLELWDRLEPNARISIIVHELAHLRRRDHWLSWLFSLVLTLFWWHPVAWWAFARARDEAEEACDAWVTSMSPTSRRTYAEAIVATKELIGSCGEGVSPRLCVVSGGVLRLRRRITMVMTSRVSPRGSWAGIATGTLLTLAGVLATPGLACPPAEPPASDDAPTRAAFQASAGMFGAQPGTPQPDASDRLADLLARLDARLSAIEARLQDAASTEPVIARKGYPIGGEPREPSPVTVQGRPSQPLLAETTPDQLTGPTPGSVSRTYTLSEGKLRAFSDLMARQDVPIWVVPGDHGIEVFATPQQQEVFAAFLAVIEPTASTHTVVGAPIGSDSRALAERYLADAERSANVLAGRRTELNERVQEVLSRQHAATADEQAAYEKDYRELVQARASLEARFQEAQAAADAAKARLRELEAERAKLSPAVPPAAPARPTGR